MQSYQDWLPNMFKAIHNTEHGQFLALPNKEGGEYVLISASCNDIYAYFPYLVTKNSFLTHVRHDQSMQCVKRHFNSRRYVSS